jgi:hypothetical protein
MLLPFVFACGACAREPVAVLDRPGCYGTCPRFKLEILANGMVLWVGLEHVAAPGVRLGRMKPAQLEALHAAFAAARFDARDAEGFIERRRDGFSFVDDDVHLVVTYHGRTVDFGVFLNGDPELIQLARQIQELAGVEDWIGRDL